MKFNFIGLIWQKSVLIRRLNKKNYTFVNKS